MKTKIIKILAIISLVFLSACNDNSSFKRSQEILAAYPESEIHQLNHRDFSVNKFLVRTKDGRVIDIVFAVTGKMLPEREIFSAKP